MTEPEISFVTLKRITWPLTEADLKTLVIAAFGGRVGAGAAEVAARSDGAFRWQIQEGHLVGAEIDVTVEADAPASSPKIEAEAAADAPFRSARSAAPETVVAKADLAEAAPPEKAPEKPGALIDQHLDHLPQPEGWPPESDLELLDMALNGYRTDDCARAFKRPPVFIQNRFDQLTGKKDGIGHVFPRAEVHRALAARLGVAVG